MIDIDQNDTLMEKGSVHNVNGTASCRQDSCVDLYGVAIHLHSYERTSESDVEDDNPAVVDGTHDVVFGHGAQTTEDDELQEQSPARFAWK